MIGAMRLGRISRTRIRRSDAPSERSASTNSASRSDSTWPRTMRAMRVQLTATMTTITTESPGLIVPPTQPLPSEHADAMPTASSRTGNASTTSMMRDSARSTQPR